MRTKIILLTNLLVAFAGLLGVALEAQGVQSDETIIAVMNPESGNNEFIFPSEIPIYSTFAANVTLMNAAYVAGWQVNITWDSTVLKINSANDVNIPTDNVFGEYALPLGLKITPDSIFWLATILDAPANHVNVTYGTLFQIRFTIIGNSTASRSCKIHLIIGGEHPNHTILGNAEAASIPFTTVDGVYEHLVAESFPTWTGIIIVSLVAAAILAYFVVRHTLHLEGLTLSICWTSMQRFARREMYTKCVHSASRACWCASSLR